MEKGTFRTLIKAEYEKFYNDYILGRISGMMCALCDHTTEYEKKCCYAITQDKEGWILKIDCYPEDYAKFECFVEGYYPGLCVFNY